MTQHPSVCQTRGFGRFGKSPARRLAVIGFGRLHPAVNSCRASFRPFHACDQTQEPIRPGRPASRAAPPSFPASSPPPSRSETLFSPYFRARPVGNERSVHNLTVSPLFSSPSFSCSQLLAVVLLSIKARQISINNRKVFGMHSGDSALKVSFVLPTSLVFHHH